MRVGFLFRCCKYVMQFYQWLLSEGKFDWTTTSLVRSIMKKLANEQMLLRLRVNRMVPFCHGDISVMFNPSFLSDMEKHCVTIEPVDNSINLLLYVRSEGSRVNSHGGFKYPNFIKVDLYVPYNVQLSHMEEVRRELVGVIRHELEHYSQTEDEYKQAKVVNDKKSLSLNRYTDYYIDPSEVASFVLGLYKFAKTSKLPLENVIDEYLSKVDNKMRVKFGDTPAVVMAIQKIKSVWMDYAKRRLR